MSALSDAIAATKASADATLTRVTADIANLNGQIVALQAQIAGGGASQADLDALAALQTELAGIDPTNPVTVTPAVVAAAKANS